MKKNEIIKKVCTGFFIMIAFLGAVMIMTRGDPADSAIGDVVVTNGYDRIALDCHKYSYNDKNGSRKIDSFLSVDKAYNIPTLVYGPNDSGCDIAVSYSESYNGELGYTVYDESYNVMIEQQPSLKIPVETGKKYFVEITVNWGEDDDNVTCKYYFGLDIIVSGEK